MAKKYDEKGETPMSEAKSHSEKFLGKAKADAEKMGKSKSKKFGRMK